MERPWNRGGVGVVERLVAVLGIVLSSPATLAAAVAIKATSRGPVLYRASRVGRHEIPFTMYKLRTMRVGADIAGTITSGLDPRVFPAGLVLRALKLDEIPQLINVARGEMSFVGPRPEAVAVVQKHYEPWMMETLQVAPGIVGPGSLSYFADEGNLPDDPTEAEALYVQNLLPRKLARELVFVRRRTLGYRFELLLRTLLSVARLRGLMSHASDREEREAAAILAQVDPTWHKQPPAEKK